MRAKMEPEQLMTASEVADLFRVHIETVYAWVRAGHLKSVRAAGTRRHLFRQADVLDFRDGCSNAGPTASEGG